MWPFNRDRQPRQDWAQDKLPLRWKAFWIAAIVIVAVIAIWQLN